MCTHGSVIPVAQKSVIWIVSLNCVTFSLCICLKDTNRIKFLFTVEILREVCSCLPQNGAQKHLRSCKKLKLKVYRKYFEKQKCKQQFHWQVMSFKQYSEFQSPLNVFSGAGASNSNNLITSSCTRAMFFIISTIFCPNLMMEIVKRVLVSVSSLDLKS